MRKIILVLLSLGILLHSERLYSEEKSNNYHPQEAHQATPEEVEEMMKQTEAWRKEEAALGNTPEEIRQAKIQKAVKDLSSEDYVVRRGAVGELGRLKAKEHAKDMAKLLADKDSRVRFVAVAALGEIDAKEYTHDAIELLKDEDAMVRVHAVRALGEFKATNAIQDIVPLLNDQGGSVFIKGSVDNTVRGAAARTLGQLGAEEYAEQIKALLQDKEFAVRKSATEALRNLGVPGPVEEATGHNEDK